MCDLTWKWCILRRIRPTVTRSLSFLEWLFRLRFPAILNFNASSRLQSSSTSNPRQRSPCRPPMAIDCLPDSVRTAPFVISPVLANTVAAASAVYRPCTPGRLALPLYLWRLSLSVESLMKAKFFFLLSRNCPKRSSTYFEHREKHFVFLLSANAIILCVPSSGLILGFIGLPSRQSFSIVFASYKRGHLGSYRLHHSVNHIGFWGAATRITFLHCLHIKDSW